jgi:hypothetical protein
MVLDSELRVLLDQKGGEEVLERMYVTLRRSGRQF